MIDRILRIVEIPVLALVFLVFTNQTDHAEGVSLWLAFAGVVCWGALLLAATLSMLGAPFRAFKWCYFAVLVFAGCYLPFVVGEIGLVVYEKYSDGPKVTMPKDWELRNAQVSQAPASFYWQGELHLKDDFGWRKINTPWPTKQPNKIRVIVLGDSLTYGLGVLNSQTYPAKLQELLGEKYEVLNLGVVGFNSTQIVDELRDNIDTLKPDLIVYGVCLNDFLPVNRTQEKAHNSYSPPIPWWIRDPLLTRTRLGAVMDKGYDKLLLTLGLRESFIDDVWRNKDYHKRFADDVKVMNALARGKNLPPIIGMVLDQYPQLGSPNYQLAQIAEVAMMDAGMTVVYTEAYYQRYSGKTMYVSPWEGHPSPEAYQIFAEMLAKEIL